MLRSIIISIGVFVIHVCSAAIPEAIIQVDGVTYKSLQSIASELNNDLVVRLKPVHEVSFTSSIGEPITLKKGARSATVGKIIVHFGQTILERKTALYISTLDWTFSLKPIVTEIKLSKYEKKLKTIVIDPGHGGKDPGALGTKHGLREKDLTLEVCIQLEKLLKKQNYKVFLTRNSDKYIPLKKRSKYATKKGADLFLSVHFNASKNTAASGIETFAYTLLGQPSTSRKHADAQDKIFASANRNDTRNALLAFHIQKTLITNTAEKDRGLKRARFTVLEDLKCPGALVELGFVSNSATATELKTKTYTSKLARLLVDGIESYRAKLSD